MEVDQKIEKLSPLVLWVNDFNAGKLNLIKGHHGIRSIDVFNSAAAWCTAHGRVKWWPYSPNRSAEAKMFHGSVRHLLQSGRPYGKEVFYTGKVWSDSETTISDAKDQTQDETFEIEEYLDEKMVGDMKHVLVHWKGFDKKEDYTWEPESNIPTAGQIWDNWQSRKRKPGDELSRSPKRQKMDSADKELKSADGGSSPPGSTMAKMLPGDVRTGDGKIMSVEQYVLQTMERSTGLAIRCCEMSKEKLSQHKSQLENFLVEIDKLVTERKPKIMEDLIVVDKRMADLDAELAKIASAQKVFASPS